MTDEDDADPTTVFTLTKRSGEVACPAEFATLRLAEALLTVKREHPEAWRHFKRAGVVLNEANIDRLVRARDNPDPAVQP